jgi:hypothetical protein
LLYRLQKNDILVDEFNKENGIDFKINISKQESELEKKTIILYVDVKIGQAYVIAMKYFHKFSGT